MGLDMYLSARKYVSGWKHNKAEETAEFNKLVASWGMADLVAKGAPSGYLELNVAYWRKANQVHNWFVQNVQSGTDDCGKYYVSREQLRELVTECQKVLVDQTVAANVLPTKAGFFFGDTEYDEYYLDDLRDTVTQINKALTAPDDWQFEYHSSW